MALGSPDLMTSLTGSGATSGLSTYSGKVTYIFVSCFRGMWVV